MKKGKYKKDTTFTVVFFIDPFQTDEILGGILSVSIKSCHKIYMRDHWHLFVSH